MPDLLPISIEQKLACLKRELHMRRHAFKTRVLAGRMKAQEAEYEISVMAAILEDYEAQLPARKNGNG